MAKGKVRVAVAGVGNCASALIQGIHYYSRSKPEDVIGLIAYDLGGITPADIEFVAAFDVDKRKVGKDLSKAIFSGLNNTPKICDVPRLGVEVQKGHVLDGLGKYLSQVIPVAAGPEVDVAAALKEGPGRHPRQLPPRREHPGGPLLRQRGHEGRDRLHQRHARSSWLRTRSGRQSSRPRASPAPGTT